MLDLPRRFTHPMLPAVLLGVVTTVVAGCGGDASTGSAATPDPDETTAEATATPQTSTEGESPPDEVAAALPADFTIRSGGGPVRMRRRQRPGPQPGTQVEPRPGTPGEFDLVVMEFEGAVDEDGFAAEVPDDAELQEVAREPVDVEDVAELVRIIRGGRAELDGECFDPNVRDGASRALIVHMDGEDATFRCTNASTPAFDDLWDTYQELVQMNTPAR